MSSKLLIFTALVTLACAYGKNITPDTNQEISRSEKEERIRIEVPLIGTVLMVTFKIAGLIMNAIGPLRNFKLAAFTLITNVTSWLYQHYFPTVIGTVALLGFCVISGTITQVYEIDHRLIQAARQLADVKYARMIN